MNALMKIAQLALLLLICSLGSVFAEVKPPGIVVDGLDTYYNYGSKAAAEFWLKDSALENVSLADRFAAIEQKYGRMIGFETMSVVPVSGSLVCCISWPFLKTSVSKVALRLIRNRPGPLGCENARPGSITSQQPSGPD